MKALDRTVFRGVPARNSRSGRAVGLRGRDGFTLVELLLAVAIVAVLTVIAVPSYQGYRDRVRVAQARSDIVAIATAIDLYRTDTRRYPDSLVDVRLDGMLDPWGHPYQYLNLSPVAAGNNGSIRKDKNLVPINSDFDLYSMGKDGASQAPLTAKVSQDDIVRASDGRFVGLAADY